MPLFLVLVPAYGVVGASMALLGGSSLRVLFTLLAYRSIAAAGARRCGSPATTSSTWRAIAAPW